VGSQSELVEAFCELWSQWRTKEKGFLPGWVAVPDKMGIEGLKRALLTRKLPIFGVEFMGPGALRRRLLALHGLPDPPCLGTWVRTWAARELLRRAQKEDLARENLLLRSLTEDPSPLVEALDFLAAYGVSYRALPLFEVEPELGQAWQELWEKLSFQDPLFSLEKLRAQVLLRSARLPGQFFAFGFGPEDAGKGSLAWVELALCSFESVALLSVEPQKGDPLGQKWQAFCSKWGSRGADNGSALPLGANPVSRGPSCQFFWVPDQQSQIQFAVRLARQWVSDNQNPRARLGIVLPKANYLAAVLADTLEDHGIPFACHLPLPSALRPEQKVLSAWTSLQKEGLLCARLLQFWEALDPLEARNGFLSQVKLSVPALSRCLWEEATRTLGQDAQQFLRGGICSQGPPVPEDLFHFRQAFQERRWPPEGRLAGYFRRFQDDARWLLGEPWGEILESLLCEELGAFARSFALAVRRESAAELLQTFVLRTEPQARGSPWAPVQLCGPRAAELDCWDGLAVLSLNREFWPEEGKALPRLLKPWQGAQESFNSQEPWSSFLPFSAPARPPWLQWRRLEGGAEKHLWLVASGFDEVELGRELEPASLFLAAWKKTNPGVPWEEALPVLLDQSRKALAQDLGLALCRGEEYAPVARAFQSRRDPETPFDPYSFCLDLAEGVGNESPSIPQLTATWAEKILVSPGFAFLSLFLGLEGAELPWTEQRLLALFRGRLLHETLAVSLPVSGLALPSGKAKVAGSLNSNWGEAWRRSLLRILRKRKEELQTFASYGPGLLPPWWESLWLELEGEAGVLQEQVLALWEGADRPPWVVAEWHLTLPSRLSNPAMGTPWPWRGQMDLVFLDSPPMEKPSHAWILEYKTSTDAPSFSQRELAAKGRYFQLVVYAAFLGALFGPKIQTKGAVAAPRISKAPEWVPLEPDSADCSPLWGVLRAAWGQGRFGLAEEIKPRYGKGHPFPIAMLPIEKTILRRKWEKTPDLRDWKRSF
jgi:hypothetical protein